ncbi:hypothetical protein [Acetobacter oryzifermentans]|uniref:Uncharacterized protein n=1 Tax=Acetobacter oryzifermentans TaxID=1633874 RepID=A0ABM6AHC3_9PROT|nr:hypothetical protein [Acetobacter oryzifermentans]ANA13107.1 hypothetical protein WG31_03035 [Acetobacter oryzifermentans]
MTTQNWPDPKRVGFPMFSDHSARHVLENKKRRSLKLVIWDHEREHYCTEIDWVTPEQMNGLDWEYHGPVLTPTQINEMLAAERERCAVECDKLADDYLPCHPSEFGRGIRNLGATQKGPEA